MSATTDTPADERLVAALRPGGHRVTSQRLVLHRALHELGRHASAEEVLQAASPRLPGLSLPTVYATLDLFVRLGVARRVDGAGNVVLYDPRTDHHHHFACRSCGRVVDVDAHIDEGSLASAARAEGLQVDGVEVTLRGLCADCRQA
ncbi:MAG: Fur family transcriptional regulator, stress-responsive regulator [Solirubrobacteraceae bacterium]|jgi:Fur family ferric uptake transcriptional regulator/Fur family peroxide stress response transcriptional regulator|nr:Fur family transcriptional regulator, stress-responsive regulator [Solirubrobacteraceae bacterium]MEA2357560.1 Fur family transcriptional regulator, stress-responsive regulator [Solirubrobacteraceae bacterium]MEA2395071.1 Fur family transcriptional regulator, stress-responsive regulator [Solirubrobacteraceae bacterium]